MRPARTAAARCAPAGIAWSWVQTRYVEGTVCQAGTVTGVVSAAASCLALRVSACW